MLPEELRAVMHETAKMMVHANALLERALGGMAGKHPELTQRTIQLEVRMNEDYAELAENIGNLLGKRARAAFHPKLPFAFTSPMRPT